MILAVISGAVAAVVSVSVVFLTRRSETMKLQQALKTAAYVDLVRGIAGLAVLQEDTLKDAEQFKEGRELMMLVADAKARIGIYGSLTVVTSLADFLRGGSVLDSSERSRAFTKVCVRLRNDSRPRLGNVPDRDIHFLLFGRELND